MFSRGVFQQANQQRRANYNRALMHHLARIGGSVFGPVPSNVRREFFCLDEHTWVWHEEWKDEQGQHHAITTRYDVRPNGVLKSQGTNSYQRLSPDEERNFRQAVNAYQQKASAEISRLQQHLA